MDKRNNLISLNISHNVIEDKNMAELLVGFSKNATLKRFWACNVKITDFSCVIFGTMLKFDQKLELLDLSENLINNESVTQIFKGIISNTTLNTLYLCNCGLNNKHIRVL